MAPEISTGEKYDGRQTDIFSVGVVLFIIVLGIFPFLKACKDDYHYNMIINGQYYEYFKKVDGQSLSDDFKVLFMKMVAPRGN